MPSKSWCGRGDQGRDAASHDQFAPPGCAQPRSGRTLLTLEALRANQTLELVALDLRIAVNAVGEIVGQTTTEDLLDKIFSQFCLGNRPGGV